MRSPQQWNTPLKSLLKDLQSEDRKTENAALKELRRRFVGLDKGQQMQVIMHHLRREKSFREWAYSRLLDLWDESFEPIIKGLWEFRTMRKNAHGLSSDIFLFLMYWNIKRT